MPSLAQQLSLNYPVAETQQQKAVWSVEQIRSNKATAKSKTDERMMGENEEG